MWVGVQAIGGALVAYGVHQLWGTGVAAIVGGALLVIAGTLGESSERKTEGEGDGPGTTD